MGRMRLALRPLIPLLLLALVAGCSSSGGALGRAESTGILAVGVVESPPATVAEEGGDVSGSEAEVVSGYAESIGASATWQVGGQEALVAAAERGEIDVVIGVSAGTSAEGMSATSDRGGYVMLVKDDEGELLGSINSYVASAG